MPTAAKSLHTSRRLDEVGFSDIVKVRNQVMALRAAGQPVYGFHGGEPYFDTPQPIKDALTAALNENKTRYAPSSGIEPLRTAIVEKLQRKNGMKHVKPEDILITVGGAHALHAAFEAVLDAGDDALVFSPYWTPIRDMIVMAQARPLLVPTERACKEGLTESLKRYYTKATRAIYYNTPQNPSGTVFTRKDAEEVAAFAIKHNLIVFADEAYEDLVYNGEHFSIATLPGMAERTITCYTLSKSYGMTGWRIGYAVASEPFMTAMRKVVLYSTNGVSTPTQWAALAALNIPEQFLTTQREEYKKRRDLLVAGLNELGFECAIPAGAFYAFARATHIHKQSREAASRLIDKAHVATIPGVIFGPQGEGHLRFGYAVPLETIDHGLEALKKFLKR
jgi:aspartate/methionine/tyrosine aminotransferase